MSESFNRISDSVALARKIPTVSVRFDNGPVVEMLYDPDTKRTAFAVWRYDRWTIESTLTHEPFRTLVPYSPYNNLIRNLVVLFPSKPEEYGGDGELVAAIQDFIHKYVDVSPRFEKLVSYYVLLSWLYDDFQELPYLRVRGDFGTGKTRFLLTVGALCYKPIFASGASTVSPLFRLLDTFRGTLIIDEGDFRVSDERAEIVKILNNGNAKGFPVLRSDVSIKGEYNPRAFAVFGPKLVASRGHFDDRALESRFLTEEMGQERLRADVPINHPPRYQREALKLRNQLLLFRFRNLGKYQPSEALVDRSIEPRLNQVFVPLASLIEDDETRRELRDLARQYNRDLVSERGQDVEAQVLEVLVELADAPDPPVLSVKAITERFIERYGEDHDRKITTKWIGWVIRRRLRLRTQKSHGVFVIPREEQPKLHLLREKYGLVANEGTNGEHPLKVDMGDVGDLTPGTAV